MKPEDLDNVDTKEAADILGVSPGTLRNWRSQKIGPEYHKHNGWIRYTLDDLRRFMDETLVSHDNE